MNQETLKQFRDTLTQHRDSLFAWYQSDIADKQVHLGGAALDEVLEVIAKLDEALKRIDTGEFGRCIECADGSDVELERLELDFTTCVCISHYSEEQVRALERDLELAAKVQQQLLPRDMPVLEGAQISAHTRPAAIVGGDYFDFFRWKSGAQGVVIADVMGKGLAASMLMSNLQASLRILGPEYENPQELALRLNELFRFNLKLLQFISLALVNVDIKTRTVQYCNAGHHPPLLWKPGSATVCWLNPTGPAIGLMPEPPFRSEILEFEPGDVLLLYTDGLIEARDPRGAEFGQERLVEFIRAHHEESADALLTGLREAVENFAGKRLQDDVTLVILKF